MQGPHPYLEVRAGLDALVARPVYYELAELALAEGADAAGPVERRRLLPAGARRMNLAARLREALERSAIARSPILIAGDVLDEEEAGHGITPAAVLVAVVDRPEPTVILTLRPETMRKHPGPDQLPRRPDRSRRRRAGRRRPARGRGGDRAAARRRSR